MSGDQIREADAAESGRRAASRDLLLTVEDLTVTFAVKSQRLFSRERLEIISPSEAFFPPTRSTSVSRSHSS